MPRRKPASNAGSNLRRAIASHAARLMAEDGIDYGLAKRKAARALGASESEALPTNDEIESELRAYQAIYQADEQPERLQNLRRTALEAMEFLQAFRPYLTGAVLDGSAGRYAEIELELFADSSKDVEIMLLSSNIEYDSIGVRSHNPNSPETRLRIEWNEDSVLLSVFPLTAERHHKRNTHTGRSAERAGASALAELIKQAHTHDASLDA